MKNKIIKSRIKKLTPEAKNRIIINKLRQNSRASLIGLSNETGFPVSTIYDKIKRMEQGVIKRYTVIIDFEKLGYKLHLLFMIKSNQTNKLAKELITHPNVNTMLITNNEYNVLLECFFRNAREMNQFTHILDNFHIKGKKMFYILDDVKREMAVVKQS